MLYACLLFHLSHSLYLLSSLCNFPSSSFSPSTPPPLSILITRRRWPLPVLHLSFSSLSFSFTSGQAAVAGQGSVGWEGVEGRRGEGGGWRWWLSFEEAINCKAQGTVKEKKKRKRKDLTQNLHCEKRS